MIAEQPPDDPECATVKEEDDAGPHVRQGNNTTATATFVGKQTGVTRAQWINEHATEHSSDGRRAH